MGRKWPIASGQIEDGDQPECAQMASAYWLLSATLGFCRAGGIGAWRLCHPTILYNQ